MLLPVAPCVTVSVIKAPVARSRVRAYVPADCKFYPRLQRSAHLRRRDDIKSQRKQQRSKCELNSRRTSGTEAYKEGMVDVTRTDFRGDG